jgi:DinB superfamily
MSLNDGWDPPGPGWACAQCGFDYDAQDLATTAVFVRELSDRYSSRLVNEADEHRAAWRERPEPGRWSALEYACHVRDCFALYHWRIRKTLAEHRPVLPAMRRDEVVTERAYNQQDPLVVAQETRTNADQLSSLLATLEDGQWERVCVRDGEDLSVEWMARNVVHEGEHHLVDIDDVLARVGTEEPLE